MLSPRKDLGPQAEGRDLEGPASCAWAWEDGSRGEGGLVISSRAFSCSVVLNLTGDSL